MVRPGDGSWSRCRAARTRSPCGTSSSTPATMPTASTSASASATTATSPADVPGVRAERGPLWPRSTCRDIRLRHPHRRGGGRRAPARRAGCPSATCSTRRPSTAATTWWRPATTSTTRPRCSSATCCAGIWPTWPASTRSCPRATVRPEGQAPGTPRRAGDGRILRPARHRLHRRGVPDGGGQQAPRLQGRAERASRCSRRARRRPSTSAFRTGARWLRRRGRGGARGLHPAPSAGRRRSARVCAFCRSSQTRPRRAGHGDPVMSRPFAGRRAGAALRQQGAPLPCHARRRAGEFHTHSGAGAARRAHRRRGGHRVRSSRGARYTAVRPTLAESSSKCRAAPR